MKKNAGFSLVELLVAITIATVVGAAVFAFMVVGARSFSSTSADVEVQNEAQVVFNQLQDMIVDTNIGIGYDDQADQTILTMYNYDPDDADKHVYEIVYDKSASRLYYNEYLPVASGDGADRVVAKGSALYTNQLMGEKIENFTADLSDMEKKRVIRLQLTFKKKNVDYSSSHNITLRNDIVLGSTIPPYVENTGSKDPEKVEGPDNVYVEPGQVIDLPSIGNFRVKADDGGNYPDQDIRFFMSDYASYDAGTSISTSGTLTVSKAQKTDFYVTAATRTGKGGALQIKVNMIIVDSVDVSLVEKSGTLEGDTFEVGETFTLKAIVKGRNLDKAATDMYGISWALTGTAGDYVTMGASSKTANGATCSFQMKAMFDLKSDNAEDPFEITATSVRSTQVPYYTGKTKTPVVGTYHAVAHGEKGDFKIVAHGPLYRGKHMNSSYVGLVDEWISSIPGFDREKHVLFAGIKVNEVLYHQEENSMSSTFTERKNIIDSGAQFLGEGTHLGIVVPKVTECNPNAAYDFDVTYYIFERRQWDYTNWQNLRVFEPGVTQKDGYSLENYKYKSNTVTQRCERLFLYYNSKTYKTNEDGSTNWQEWTGDMTESVRPRIAQNGGWQDQVIINIPLIECDNVEDYGIRNFMGNRESFKIYYKKDNTWIKFDDSRKISSSGEYKGLANVLKARYENSNLRIEYYPDRWTEDVPQMVRIAPNLMYKQAGMSSEEEAVLFDNYTEVYLWNIEVPTVKDYQVGKGTGFLGRTIITRLYFPSPMDPEFLELPKDSYKEWVYPYPTNVAAHKEDIKRLKLSYKLSYNADGKGNKTWYLHLKYYDTTRNEFVEVGKYMCKDSDRVWTSISDNKVPDNLTFN